MLLNKEKKLSAIWYYQYKDFKILISKIDVKM